MSTENYIDYIEFPTTDLPKSKIFFEIVFGWEFKDYGPDYSSFKKAGVEGGFYTVQPDEHADSASVLVVLYSPNLERTQSHVEDSGGIITKEAFSFPGGRRFHFREPGGNELAVWTDSDE